MQRCLLLKFFLHYIGFLFLRHMIHHKNFSEQQLFHPQGISPSLLTRVKFHMSETPETSVSLKAFITLFDNLLRYHPISLYLIASATHH